jgi:hypothetical protein
MFGCCLFLGQSAGGVIAARVFSNLHSAWGFGAAGAGLTALDLGFAHLMQRCQAR